MAKIARMTTNFQYLDHLQWNTDTQRRRCMLGRASVRQIDVEAVTHKVEPVIKATGMSNKSGVDDTVSPHVRCKLTFEHL